MGRWLLGFDYSSYTIMHYSRCSLSPSTQEKANGGTFRWASTITVIRCGGNLLRQHAEKFAPQAAAAGGVAVHIWRPPYPLQVSEACQPGSAAAATMIVLYIIMGWVGAACVWRAWFYDNLFWKTIPWLGIVVRRRGLGVYSFSSRLWGGRKPGPGWLGLKLCVYLWWVR